MSFKKRLARFRRAQGHALRLLTGADERLHLPQRAAGQVPQTQYYSLGPDRAMVRLLDGMVIFVDPQDEQISAQLILYGQWEASVHKAVLSMLEPGNIVIEVGANVGYHTLGMAAAVGSTGSVTTLEANPRLTDLLERSIRINGFTDRVTVLNKAAMDQPGTISFVTSRTQSGGGYVSIWDHTIHQDGQTIDVESVRLDDLGHDRVDMIRVDAEGCEPFVMRGAERLISTNPDIILCMEWMVYQMQSRGSVQDFVDWLIDQGLSFWRIELDRSLKSIAASELADLGPSEIVASRRHPLNR